MWTKHQIGTQTSYTKKIDNDTYEVITINHGMVTWSKNTFQEYSDDFDEDGRKYLADEFKRFYGKEPKDDAELMVVSSEAWSVWSADKQHDYQNEEELQEILKTYGIC